MEINSDRLISEFKKLVSIDSPTLGERKMCDYLTGRLKELGFDVFEDDAGSKIGGSSGNLYGMLAGRGDRKNEEPLLFSAHMDTVEPARGKRAVIHEDGRITSAGDTVLGADDAAGLAAIIEAAASIRERGLPHRPIEVLFTVAEEVYCAGASCADFSHIRAKEAYVFDLSGTVGTGCGKAPTITGFTAEVIGKAAHAGFAARDGVHAISAASRAISRMPLGKIDEDTTVNIGTISGGTAANIVPERCIVRGEIRSYSHQRAEELLKTVRALFDESAREIGAELEFSILPGIRAYKIPQSHRVVRRFSEVCAKQGLPGNLVSSFGGSDNNIFALRGITGIVLATAMLNCHSREEYTSTDELCRAASLAAGLMAAES